MDPVEKSNLLMEVEMEASGQLDPDCWTSETTSVTQELDPVCKTSEEGTVTQKFDQGGGNGHLWKVGLTKELLNPEFNGRKIRCIVIVLMKWIIAVSTLISTLRSQESLHRTLGLGGIFWTLGLREGLSELWTNFTKESNLSNGTNIVKLCYSVENDVGRTFYKDYILDLVCWGCSLEGRT